MVVERCRIKQNEGEFYIQTSFISKKKEIIIKWIVNRRNASDNRYDKVSKEKDFAEYYLLGTLMSTVMVIIVSFLI